MKYSLLCLLYSTFFIESNANTEYLVKYDCNDTENGFECTQITEDSDNKLLLFAEDENDEDDDEDDGDELVEENDDEEEDEDADDDADDDQNDDISEDEEDK